MFVVSVKTYLSPVNLSRAPKVQEVVVETFYEVDGLEIDEGSFISEGVYLLKTNILGSSHGEEVGFGVGACGPDEDEIIEEICLAFEEYAGNQEYIKENEEAYDEDPDEIISELDNNYDYLIVEAICDILYGKSGQELEVEELEAFGDTENWYVDSQEVSIVSFTS